MEVMTFVSPRDETSFKRPTDVFIDFADCQVCGALYLITEINNQCHQCGPGRIAFDEQVKSIHDEILRKNDESKKHEIINTVCKVCKKIH
jgi:hypothetical protein